jgi:hypothetical protein
MFCGPRIVIYLYNKDQQDALFTFSFIPINNLYMFRAGLLHIILYIQRTILYIQQYSPILLAASRYKRMTYTNWCKR